MNYVLLYALLGCMFATAVSTSTRKMGVVAYLAIVVFWLVLIPMSAYIVMSEYKRRHP